MIVSETYFIPGQSVADREREVQGRGIECVIWKLLIADEMYEV